MHMLIVKNARSKRPNQTTFNHQDLEFSNVFLESLDETLNQILGKTPANMVYYYLQRYFSLRKKKIPAKLRDFAEALEKFFGTEALLIEKILVKNLYAKFEMDFAEREDFDFVEQVDSARRKMEERKWRQPLE